MKIEEVVKKYFGYDGLRKGQSELVWGILEGEDVLGIMPTGAGKSLCYQASALMLSGITIVISPLISLMIDQVKALNEAGIHAAYINSSLTEGQVAKALELAAQGRYKIIYVAPERLKTSRFLYFASQADISMVTVDEAHCISQWGQDFRPSYREIVDFLKMLPKRPILSAFTATATELVKQDIRNILGLRQPKVVVTGFDRPNLYFRVITRKGGKETDNAILNYTQKHPQDSGIIYCATRKNVDKLYELLMEYGITVGKYHGGMSMEERAFNQEEFTYDRIQVMVATNAFGMGIDKSNVRYVLHYNMPQSIEYYYQEAGRAGRDGEESECILFYSKQDIMINRRLIDMKTVDAYGNSINEDVRRNDMRKLYQMIDYCETGTCLREFMLRYFGETGECTCEKCSNCVVDKEVYDEQVYIGKKPKVSTARLDNEYLSESGKSLFEHIRGLRAELARDNKVAPFIICSDNTLKDMCLKLPKNVEDMVNIYGMGEKKIEQYGDRFIDSIKVFLDNFNGDESDIKKSVIFSKKSSAKKKLEDFYITYKQLEKIEPQDELMMISDIANLVNDFTAENECKKLVAKTINEWLLLEDYIIDVEINDRKCKRVTEKGFILGITEEEREGKYGKYYAILHNKDSQKKILELIGEKYAR